MQLSGGFIWKTMNKIADLLNKFVFLSNSGIFFNTILSFEFTGLLADDFFKYPAEVTDVVKTRAESSFGNIYPLAC